MKPWPDRYRITFESIKGDSHSYSVCTWQAKEKAIALTALEHCRLKRPDIHKVQVDNLGRAPKDESGIVELVSGDILDRMEW